MKQKKNSKEKSSEYKLYFKLETKFSNLLKAKEILFHSTSFRLTDTFAVTSFHRCVKIEF